MFQGLIHDLQVILQATENVKSYIQMKFFRNNFQSSVTFCKHLGIVIRLLPSLYTPIFNASL